GLLIYYIENLPYVLSWGFAGLPACYRLGYGVHKGDPPVSIGNDHGVGNACQGNFQLSPLVAQSLLRSAARVGHPVHDKRRDYKHYDPAAYSRVAFFKREQWGK